VFDFDKTLTCEDTLFGFYRQINKNNVFFQIKRLLYLGVAVLVKSGFFNNDHLKTWGVFLFLKGKNQEEIEKAASVYGAKIHLNNLFHEVFQKYPKEERMILSASFENYLKHCLPGENIVASKLCFKNGRVKGLKRNLYGEHKKETLKAMGIPEINEFYTDSYNDRPLMQLTTKVWIVNKGKVVKDLTNQTP